MSDVTLDRVFVSLRILGGVQPNKRVATQTGALRIEDDSYLLGLRRAWFGESRESNIKFLEAMFQDVFSLIASKLDQKGEEIGQPFYSLDNLRQQSKDALERSRTGLLNLCETYAHDINMVKRLEWLVSKVNSFVVEILELTPL
tara:strand:+ start:11050 stop:11481 length:432 start_codon:yes stop_codon:yes gene_type:complete